MTFQHRSLRVRVSGVGRAIARPASIDDCVTLAVSAPPALPHSHPCGHRYGGGQKFGHKDRPLPVLTDIAIIRNIFLVVNNNHRRGGERVKASKNNPRCCNSTDRIERLMDGIIREKGRIIRVCFERSLSPEETVIAKEAARPSNRGGSLR